MDVDLVLAAFVERVLDLFEHARGLQFLEGEVDAFLEQKELFFGVDAGPEPLEILLGRRDRRHHLRRGRLGPLVRHRGRGGRRLRSRGPARLRWGGLTRLGGLFRRLHRPQVRRFGGHGHLCGGRQMLEYRRGLGRELEPGLPRHRRQRLGRGQFRRPVLEPVPQLDDRRLVLGVDDADLGGRRGPSPAGGFGVGPLERHPRHDPVNGHRADPVGERLRPAPEHHEQHERRGQAEPQPHEHVGPRHPAGQQAPKPVREIHRPRAAGAAAQWRGREGHDGYRS
jgi:hypothetical protein